MTVRIPSMRSLIAFEATARLGSMTAAAEEERATQPAISQRIRALEEALGMPLFDRQGGRLTLTAQGERFHRDIAQGLTDIRAACDRVSEASRNPSPAITMAAGSGFTHLWLLPRLPALERAFPDRTFRLMPVDRSDDPELQAADIAIRFGPRAPQGRARLVISESVFPVCSPEYAERQRPVRGTEVPGPGAGRAAASGQPGPALAELGAVVPARGSGAGAPGGRVRLPELRPAAECGAGGGGRRPRLVPAGGGVSGERPTGCARPAGHAPGPRLLAEHQAPPQRPGRSGRRLVDRRGRRGAAPDPVRRGPQSPEPGSGPITSGSNGRRAKTRRSIGSKCESGGVG
ncbi:MAG: LysR family transcriptional regulator [Gammaproteobacteria bacterium]|nr:LysR family transcriptional regulator [Gammaproteobacteria bacterium]